MKETINAIMTILCLTTSEWEKKDIVLYKGEIGADSVLRTIKIGNGIDKWSELKPFITMETTSEIKLGNDLPVTSDSVAQYLSSMKVDLEGLMNQDFATKSELNDYATKGSLSKVGTSGIYSDLLNKPLIPTDAAQVNGISYSHAQNLTEQQKAIALSNIGVEDRIKNVLSNIDTEIKAVSFEEQNLTSFQKQQAIENLSLADKFASHTLRIPFELDRQDCAIPDSRIKANSSFIVEYDSDDDFILAYKRAYDFVASDGCITVETKRYYNLTGPVYGHIDISLETEDRFYSIYFASTDHLNVVVERDISSGRTVINSGDKIQYGSRIYIYIFEDEGYTIDTLSLNGQDINLENLDIGTCISTQTTAKYYNEYTTKDLVISLTEKEKTSSSDIDLPLVITANSLNFVEISGGTSTTIDYFNFSGKFNYTESSVVTLTKGTETVTLNYNDGAMFIEASSVFGFQTIGIMDDHKMTLTGEPEESIGSSFIVFSHSNDTYMSSLLGSEGITLTISEGGSSTTTLPTSIPLTINSSMANQFTEMGNDTYKMSFANVDTIIDFSSITTNTIRCIWSNYSTVGNPMSSDDILNAGLSTSSEGITWTNCFGDNTVFSMVNHAVMSLDDNGSPLISSSGVGSCFIIDLSGGVTLSQLLATSNISITLE